MGNGDDKEKNKKDYLHDTDTAFDRAMKKMEERDNRIEHLIKSPLEEAVERMNRQNELLEASGLLGAYPDAVASANEVAQAISPLQGVLDRISPDLSTSLEPLLGVMSDVSVENMSAAMESMGSIISAISTAESMAATEPTMYDVLDSINRALEPYNAYEYWEHSGIMAALETAAETTELLSLRAQFSEGLGCGLMAMSHYVSSISSVWESSVGIADIARRSTPAPNIAILRMIPDYGAINIPRGGKTVLRALTKRAADRLTKSETVRFDYRENNFYHESTPEYKVNAYQISVVESAVDLFEGITFDELVQFESTLADNVSLAIMHPVGKKIFDIISGWDKLVSFEDITYFHARRLGKGQMPFSDHEMLKAPMNVSGHGRYNHIGRSCYYIAETRDGAVNEMKKHSGGQDICVQVIGVRAVRAAKIIDLSDEPKSRNCFIEHLRYTVENEEGRYIKEYLLPNFVADCCKGIGIDGIRYLSSGYCCIVLWNDDFFEFVDGTRDTIDCP